MGYTWRAAPRALYLAVPTTVGCLLGWAGLHSSAPGPLVGVGSPNTVVQGVPGTRTSVDFRFKNRAGRAVRPAVLWRNCSCQGYEILPPSLRPMRRLSFGAR